MTIFAYGQTGSGNHRKKKQNALLKGRKKINNSPKIIIHVKNILELIRVSLGLIKSLFPGKTHTMFGADWEYIGNNAGSP